MISRQKADASEASVDGFVKFRQDYVKHCKDSKALWRNHGWDRIPFDAFIARVEALEEAGDSNIFGAFPMYNDIKNMNQIPVDILFRDFELRKWCKMVVQERDRAETNPTDPVFETFIDPANRKLLLMRVGSDLLMSYPYRTVSRLQLPQTWLDLSKAVMVWKRGFDDYVLEPYGPTYTEWSDDASYEQVIEDCRRNAWLPPSKALASTPKAEGSGSSGNRGRASSSCAGSVAGSSTSSPARTRKSGKKDDDAYRAWKKEQNAAKRARREARKAEESAVAQDEEWMR